VVTKNFLQALEIADEEARRQMIYQQPLPLDPKIVPALIDCLSGPSSVVCEAAVDALGNCSEPYSIGRISPICSLRQLYKG